MLPTIRNGDVQISGEKNWRALAERFLESADVSQSSLNVYRKGLQYFLDWLDTDRPTKDTILAYKKRLIDTELKPHTVNLYLSTIRAFFTYLEGEMVYLDIARHVKNVKVSRNHHKDALTNEQVQRLFDTITVADEVSKRDYAIVTLMLYAPLRTAEIVNADVGDIRNKADKTVLYFKGKGRIDKSDYKVLTPVVIDAIQDCLATRRAVKDDEPLFISYSNNSRGKRLSTKTIRDIADRWLKQAGIKTSRITAHSFRHTAITSIVKNGGTLRQAQLSAGHANSVTTEIYVHDFDRLENPGEELISYGVQR